MDPDPYQNLYPVTDPDPDTDLKVGSGSEKLLYKKNWI